ncbi:Uncharacterised protein [Vibrio cholerae]|nr:Uncharacterised protein [Vibrio cholerae]CSB49533.1 Uncharacterised protein [Vibrio cholerae]CSB76285.1 Uncharacterised protein [Vibrio cholerae]CSB81666.1 Uncharacterised protein [Vibrio cholerae]
MALPWGKFSDLKCNLIKSALGCSTTARGEVKVSEERVKITSSAMVGAVL